MDAGSVFSLFCLGKAHREKELPYVLYIKKTIRLKGEESWSTKR